MANIAPSTTDVPIDQAYTVLLSFNSFLTVAIHNILYYRNIYPPRTFLSARAYNLPVHQNRHPKVCGWIRDAVNAVAAQLAGGNVARIAVVIHSALRPATIPSSKSSSSINKNNKPITTAPGTVLERWLFDVSHFPTWPSDTPGATAAAESMRDFGEMLSKQAEEEEETHDSDAIDPANLDPDPANLDPDLANLDPDLANLDPDPANPDLDTDDDDTADVSWADVDEQLRGALRRMAHAAECMDALPEGCTFTVAVEMKEEGAAPIGHPRAWIPSRPSLQTASKKRPQAGKDVGGAKTTPIRSVEAGPLFFECWVEEAEVKEAPVVSSKSQSQPARS